MKIKYNSPLVLTFSLLTLGLLVLDSQGDFGYTLKYFTAPSHGQFDLADPLSYLRLLSHIFAHSSLAHWSSNFFIILLVGPLLEEKYGAKRMAVMILATAAISGIVNASFMDAALIGASGVTFMMILLASFTDVGKAQIPLTFILIAVMYLTGELFSIFREDNISQLSHLIGGGVGSYFGFFYSK